LIKVEDRIILPEIIKIINSLLNQENVLEDWKVWIIVPDSRKSDKTV